MDAWIGSVRIFHPLMAHTDLNLLTSEPSSDSANGSVKRSYQTSQNVPDAKCCVAHIMTRETIRNVMTFNLTKDKYTNKKHGKNKAQRLCFRTPGPPKPSFPPSNSGNGHARKTNGSKPMSGVIPILLYFCLSWDTHFCASLCAWSAYLSVNLHSIICKSQRVGDGVVCIRGGLETGIPVVLNSASI